MKTHLLPTRVQYLSLKSQYGKNITRGCWNRRNNCYLFCKKMEMKRS